MVRPELLKIRTVYVWPGAAFEEAPHVMVRAGALVEPPPVTTTLVGEASVVAAEIADVESVAAETT